MRILVHIAAFVDVPSVPNQIGQPEPDARHVQHAQEVMQKHVNNDIAKMMLKGEGVDYKGAVVWKSERAVHPVPQLGLAADPDPVPGPNGRARSATG